MDPKYGHSSFKEQIRSRVLGLQTQLSCPESTECEEKVEAMLSTAVLHLADLWNMVTLEFSEWVASDPRHRAAHARGGDPPVVLSAMESKLENSLQWCQLARSRLRDITQLGISSPDSSSPSIKRVASFPSTTRHHELSAQVPSSNRILWQSNNRGVMESLSFANFALPSSRSPVIGVQ